MRTRLTPKFEDKVRREEESRLQWSPAFGRIPVGREKTAFCDHHMKPLTPREVESCFQRNCKHLVIRKWGCNRIRYHWGKKRLKLLKEKLKEKFKKIEENGDVQ